VRRWLLHVLKLSRNTNDEATALTILDKLRTADFRDLYPGIQDNFTTLSCSNLGTRVSEVFGALAEYYPVRSHLANERCELIAYEHYDDRLGWHTALLPPDGGAPVKVFDFHAFRAGVRWTNDGQALLYTNAHRPDNIWRQPLAGGPPQQVTHFKEDQIGYFDVSPDGKQIAMARGNAYSDVVLITNFH